MKTMIRILFVSIAVGLTGCYGAADEGAAGSTIGLTDVSPLPLVSRAAWTAAAAGCEDRLDGVDAFGVADGEPGLVVALSAEGDSICTDALEAVDLELRERGQGVVADDLCARYLVVLDATTTRHRRDTSSTVPQAADPSPQPNLVGAQLNLDKADPSP